MVSIEAWRKWILTQLLSEGVYNYRLEQTLRAAAGHNIDANFDKALQQLMDEGVVTLIETEGQRRYGIPLSVDKLQTAKRILNSTTAVSTPQPTIVQEYIPEPKGFLYWRDASDSKRSKKKSIYSLYYKMTDRQCYAARIISQSSAKHTTIHVGSMNDPNSFVSKGWRIVNDIIGKNSDGTCSLQEALTRDTGVFGSNKRRGRVLFAIYLAEGWIEFGQNRGNEVRFQITGSKSSQPLPPSLELYFGQANTETGGLVDFNDSWSESEESETVSVGNSSTDKAPQE